MNLNQGATFDDDYMQDIDTCNILGEAFLPLDSLRGFGNVSEAIEESFFWCTVEWCCFNWLVN